MGYFPWRAAAVARCVRNQGGRMGRGTEWNAAGRARPALETFSQRGQMGLVYQAAGHTKGSGEHLRKWLSQRFGKATGYVREGGEHLR